jgi:hypothetical protein
VFFARFYAILWELRHAILIGGMGKRDGFTRGRFGLRDARGRCRCRFFVLAQASIERSELGAEPCCD